MERDKFTCEQNHSFMSNKYVSQASFQTLQTTDFQANFQSQRSNLLQDCPSVLPFAVAVLFIPSFDVFSGFSLCFTQFGGSFYCWDFQKNFLSYPTFKHAHSREQLLRPHSNQIYARSQKRELWAQDLKTTSSIGPYKEGAVYVA